MKESVLLWIAGICIGLTLSSYIFPLGNQNTVVTITHKKGAFDLNFKSNRLKDGDTYFIILDGDTLSSGVVVSHEWR